MTMNTIKFSTSRKQGPHRSKLIIWGPACDGRTDRRTDGNASH